MRQEDENWLYKKMEMTIVAKKNGKQTQNEK